MKDIRTTEYLEKLKSVQLLSDAKLRMREELSSFADFHSVRVAVNERSIEQVQSNSVFTLFTHSKSRIMNATLLIALMIGTGGTTFAAQNTVPGDFLYPVKVYVNENVRSTLAVGADAEAKLQADIFAERLQEARTLALHGNQDVAASASVRASIDAQREKTLAVAAKASDSTKAAVRKEVAKTFLAAQRVLVNSSLAIATSNSVSASSPAISMEAYNPTSMAMDVQGGGVATASFDAKMMVAPEAYSEESHALSLVDELFVRIEAIRAALAVDMEIDSEVKSSIEKDLDRASLWARGPEIMDALNLVVYIESFLGISFNGETQGDVQTTSDTDAPDFPFRSLPMPMPVDIDFDGQTDAGYGTDGNVGSVQSDIMIDSSAGVSSEGQMIDPMMDVNSSLETSGRFGF